jgi:hypothetical protein
VARSEWYLSFSSRSAARSVAVARQAWTRRFARTSAIHQVRAGREAMERAKAVKRRRDAAIRAV